MVKDIEDMTYNITNYDNPLSFFQDLQKGGCASGMVGIGLKSPGCLLI